MDDEHSLIQVVGDDKMYLNLIAELFTAKDAAEHEATTLPDGVQKLQTLKRAEIYSSLCKQLRDGAKITHDNKNTLFFWIQSFVEKTWPAISENSRLNKARIIETIALVGHLVNFVSACSPSADKACGVLTRTMAELENDAHTLMLGCKTRQAPHPS